MTTEVRLYTEVDFSKVATISCENELMAIYLAETSTKSGEYMAFVGPYGTTDVEYKNGEKQLTYAEKKAQKTDYPYIRLWCRYYGFNNDVLQSRLSRARKEQVKQTAVFPAPNKIWQHVKHIDTSHLRALLILAVE